MVLALYSTLTVDKAAGIGNWLLFIWMFLISLFVLGFW